MGTPEALGHSREMLVCSEEMLVSSKEIFLVPCGYAWELKIGAWVPWGDAWVLHGSA